MKRQLFAVALILVGSTGLPLAQQATTTEAPLVLSHDEMEQFLLKAEVVARKGVSKGVTDTIRATLSDGRIKHEAQIQTVDIQKSVFEAGKATELNFKDTYRFNIGAYRLARSSPVIDQGVPRLDFLSSKVKLARDFFGEIGLRGAKVDIGIDEIR